MHFQDIPFMRLQTEVGATCVAMESARTMAACASISGPYDGASVARPCYHDGLEGPMVNSCTGGAHTSTAHVESSGSWTASQNNEIGLEVGRGGGVSRGAAAGSSRKANLPFAALNQRVGRVDGVVHHITSSHPCHAMRGRGGERVNKAS